MGVLLRAHAGHRAPLRARRASSSRPTSRTRSCRPGCTRSCWLQAAQADAAGAGLRPRHPAQRPRGDLRQHRRQGHQPAAGGVGRPQPRHPAQGPALALPRGRAADRRVHPGDPPGQPARRRGGLHPGVRRRAAGGSSCSTTRPRCGSRAGCSSRRASWSSPCPTSCGPPRSPRSVASATRSGCTPGTCAAGASRSRAQPTGRRRTGPRAATPVPGGRAGARGWGSASRSRSGPVAHGGHCVARLPEPESRVVFVRHALPGERVVVEITEGTDGDRFWRGDAVRSSYPSADRVEPPCPYAGPGLCGGCDFQHVALPAQRDLKTAVVREQLVRLGRLDADSDLVTGLHVEAVPVAGRDDDGLRWRTRQRYAVLPDGRPAMRAHRSHELVAVDDCLIAAEGARRRRAPTRRWSRRAPRPSRDPVTTTSPSAQHPPVLRRRRRLLAGAPRGAPRPGRDGARPARPAAGRARARPLRRRRAVRPVRRRGHRRPGGGGGGPTAPRASTPGRTWRR